MAPTEVPSPLNMEPRVRVPLRAFTILDAVCLTDVFENRARVMPSVPFVMRGAFRSALRIALQEIIDGTEAQSEVRTVRGWKLLLLLPRMLLYRGHCGGLIPRKQLETQLRQFQNGDWFTLLTDARCAEQSHTHSVRGRRRSQPDEVQRASHAMSLVQVGELSAARQALEGAALAPGSLATLRVLTDPERVHDGRLYGWGQSPISPPGNGSQSWLFCPLISLALAAAEPGSRSPLPDVQRDFWNSQAAQIIHLCRDHFQSLAPDSEVARAVWMERWSALASKTLISIQEVFQW